MENTNYNNPEQFSQAHQERYRHNDPIKEIFERMGITEAVRDKTILDVGSGDGTHTKEILDSGAKIVIGLDMSEKLVRSATEKNLERDLSFIVGDLNALPIADEVIDTVHARFSLHYTNDVKKSLQEIHRVLTRDGEAFVVIPHPDDLYRRFKYQVQNENQVTQEIYPGFQVTYPFHSMQEYFNDFFFEHFEIQTLEQKRLQEDDGENKPDIIVFKIKKIQDTENQKPDESIMIRRSLNTLFYKTILDEKHRVMFAKIFTKYDVDQTKLKQAFFDYNLSLGEDYVGGNAFYSEIYASLVLMIHGFAKESYHEIREQTAQKLITASGGTRIAEIGYGYPSPHIIELLKESSVQSYDLLDFDEKINTFSKDVITDMSPENTSKVSTKNYNMDDMTSPGDYDTYVYLDSMEHAKDPTAYLQMLVASTKQDARFVLSIPVMSLENNPIEKFHNHEWKTIGDSRKWLEDNGLEIIEENVAITNPDIDQFAKFLPQKKLVNHLVLCKKKKSN
jgi:ubiquinone/menaquinone biosynthesis C-methylase UbiE